MTLEDEALRMQEPRAEGPRTVRRDSPAWRWIARVVLFGFIALIFGFSYVYAERPTAVFLFSMFFIAIVYLVGQVYELRREVAELRARGAGMERGKEGTE